MTPRPMPRTSTARVLRARHFFTLLTCIFVLLVLSSACRTDEHVMVESTFVELVPYHFFWERAVCDVCSAIRGGMFRGDFIVEDLSAFSFVLCLWNEPVNGKRDTCRMWLEREMSKYPWATLKRVYDEVNLQDLAEWRIAMLAAPNEEYRRRNPPPSHLRRLERHGRAESLREHGQRALADYREDWRKDQTWRKVNPAEHGKDGRAIATLQQQIIAIEQGGCPHCCVQFAVSFTEGFQVRRLTQALNLTGDVWFVGLGGGGLGPLEGRIWPNRERHSDYCEALWVGGQPCSGTGESRLQDDQGVSP